jgi:hypothetical protein
MHCRLYARSGGDAGHRRWWKHFHQCGRIPWHPGPEGRGAPASGVLVADAGVILETADQYLAEREHLFPLDLGAKGSCLLVGSLKDNTGISDQHTGGSIEGADLVHARSVDDSSLWTWVPRDPATLVEMFPPTPVACVSSATAVCTA